MKIRYHFLVIGFLFLLSGSFAAAQESIPVIQSRGRILYETDEERVLLDSEDLKKLAERTSHLQKKTEALRLLILGT